MNDAPIPRTRAAADAASSKSNGWDAFDMMQHHAEELERELATIKAGPSERVREWAKQIEKFDYIHDRRSYEVEVAQFILSFSPGPVLLGEGAG